MVRTFKIAWKIKNTYQTNSIIHALKTIPLIGKFLPAELYGIGALKTFAAVLSVLWNIVRTFLGKFLYVLLLCIIPFVISQTQPDYAASAFVHIFILLTLGGVYNNNIIFSTDIQDYYAVIVFNMNAREYVLSNYIYSLLRLAIGYLPALALMGTFAVQVPLVLSLAFPLFVVAAKTMFSHFSVWAYEKTGKTMNDLVPTWIVLIVELLLLAAAAFLPFIHMAIPVNVCYILIPVVCMAGAFSAYKLFTYQNYNVTYRSFLNENKNNAEQIKTTAVQATVDNSRKYIGNNLNIGSNKKGFEYLNDLFIKRHKKLLMRPVIIISAGAALVFSGVALISIFMPTAGKDINKGILNAMSVFPFILYMISRGPGFTQALFINCDHSMLTFPFFKQPKAILKLFSIRLWELIKINLIPAAVIALGMSVALAISGGADRMVYYLLIPFTILMMSVFFSVHYMTIYYLLQPYTANTEIKCAPYSFINCFTYFVCYMFMQFDLEPFSMSIVVSAFCVIYCICACALVYRFAAKTFKIRT